MMNRRGPSHRATTNETPRVEEDEKIKRAGLWAMLKFLVERFFWDGCFVLIYVDLANKCYCLPSFRQGPKRDQKCSEKAYYILMLLNKKCDWKCSATTVLKSQESSDKNWLPSAIQISNFLLIESGFMCGAKKRLWFWNGLEKERMNRKGRSRCSK